MDDRAERAAVRATPAFERALGLLVLFFPFFVALSRASSTGQWRDDLPAVRDLGLVAVGVGGALSTLLTQALGLLPLGSRTFRAALGSAMALSVASYLLYAIGCRVLRLVRPESSKLAAILSAIAALTAALSPTWQREATVGGGAMLATAAALCALALSVRELGLDPDPASLRSRHPMLGGGARVWLSLGALLGATLAESLAAGVTVLLSVGALVAARIWTKRASRDRIQLPPLRVLLPAAAMIVLVFCLFLAPLALRPLAPRAWVDVGRALSTSSLSALDVASARTTALSAWISEVGVASLGIALFGAFTAIVAKQSRPVVAPLFVLLLADTLVPASAAGVLSADPLTPLRSLAVAVLSLGSALGVQEVVALLRASAVPMARAGAVLIVVFHLTLIALTSEEAGFVADRSEQMAAEEWADQALGALEPSSAILVRSPSMSWRLWASLIVRGERPDVVVIPIPLLDRGHVAASLLANEPELEPLLRDFALTGEPSESALSRVADVRPLHVELDREWSKRLVAHLVVDGVWLEFAPQPLGASDRKQAAAATLAPLGRVLTAANAGIVPDASTSTILAAALRAQAKVLTMLGDTKTATTFLEEVSLLHPEGVTFGATPALRTALGGIVKGAKRER